MGNDKSSLPKPTGITTAQTTQTVSKVDAVANVPEVSIDTTIAIKSDASGKPEMEAVKTVSNTIKTTTPADSIADANKPGNTLADKNVTDQTEVVAGRTKMDIATEIYKRMKKTKGITRKEILEQFMTEANLSKAGASTYFQLIKAKNS